ncbi:MAG: ABC transporter ATP-binding protein, partial [Lachnospiraceae bacterium]|nr:ABC transporter ATP-binding protein [Lachnospiraceae bacterium]
MAIARALINNPDILLADEPTGALDSETSVQIMELLKEIAKDKLVIMVTHNPELAKMYSTRIIKLFDGRITGDTNPCEQNEIRAVSAKHHKISMSFLTALSLSFNNLRTKKGRTLLTAFAGSIGIIGIALILSLSTGMQEYIDQIQEDTLTSYPLSITAESSDITGAVMGMVSEEAGKNDGTNTIKEKQFMSTMFNSIGTNDLKTFKKYIESKPEVKEMVTHIDYSYSVIPQIYTKVKDDNKLVQLNPGIMSNMGMSSMGGGMSVSRMSSVFSEMVDTDSVKKNYNVIAGRWPSNYDEMIIVLSDPHEISDMLVYSLGLKNPEDLQDMITKLMNGEEVKDDSEPLTFDYNDLLNLDLRLIHAADTYKYNGEYEVYESMLEDKEYMDALYKKATRLKIVGIVCPKEGETGTISQGVAYSDALTKHIVEKAQTYEIVKKQMANTRVDVFSNNGFDEEKKEEKGIDFADMITVDSDMLADAFGMDVNQEDIAAMTGDYMEQISASITTDTQPATTAFNDTLSQILTGALTEYYEKNKDEASGTAMITTDKADSLVDEYMATQKVQTMLLGLEEKYLVPKDVYISTYKQIISGLISGYASSSPTAPNAVINEEVIATLKDSLSSQALVQQAGVQMGNAMTEAVMKKTVLTKVGALTQELMGSIAGGFGVDTEKIAGAFKFDLSEDELKRLMEAMAEGAKEKTAKTNLISLGYQDMEDPSVISLYFEDFERKEKFTDFVKAYNEQMEAENKDDQVISYTDIIGLLISSVKTIVDNVSYVLISFVSISLVVSSIMIGIITYISVLERTKEIGILRSIGASKKDISRVFNAETI